MDLRSDGSCVESVKDSDSIPNVSASAAGTLDERANNGSCLVEGNCDSDYFPKEKTNGNKMVDLGTSPPSELKHEVSPSTSVTMKGLGLKKWRRFKRDVNKTGGGSPGARDTPEQGLSRGMNPSKRLQIFAGSKQKSEGSVSSTNAVNTGLDRFSRLVDSELVSEPLFAAGTDSENSEDHSSKSSTAASAPKIMYENRGVEGFPHDKSSSWSLSGKNMDESGKQDLRIQSRVESGKKARGEIVKIEKENSYSSLESDSRSSNFTFMQGRYSTNNGLQSERPNESDGQNGDEIQGSERKYNGLRGRSSRDHEGEYKINSDDDVAVDLSWKREEGCKSGSSIDQDPLTESILALQSVQEALEKEVLQFREMNLNVSIDDSVQDLSTVFEDIDQDIDQKLCETRSAWLESDEHLQIPLIIETTNQNMETEFEDLFMLKIETEIKCILISRIDQNLRVATVGQISGLAIQKSSDPEKIRNKAEIENFCEDITTANETLKLKKQICKHTLCLSVQLVLLIVLLGGIMFQLSTDYVEVVPT